MWLFVGCLGASQPSVVVAPSPGVEPTSAPVSVPLALDHDLFTEFGSGSAGVGHHFRVTTWPASVAAWPVPLAPRASPDALAIVGEVTIPVGLAGRTLYVVTAGYGGLDSKGVAAELDVVYAGGRTDNTRFLVGEHTWPAWAGVTGRNTNALVLGRNTGGDVLTAAVRAIPIEPGVSVERLVLRPRGGLALYLLAVAIDGASPSAGHSAADEGPPDGYSFAVPLGRAPALPGRSTALRGAVAAAGEALVFPDGAPARFWGVNLVGKGALPAPERADSVATGLAARGFDLVRLHHIDTEATLLNPRRLEVGQPLVRPDALDRLGPKADKVQALFITVDPARDTPQVVKQFADAFGPRIKGLTGTAAQIETVGKAYRVYYKEHRTGTGTGDYTMDHSSVLYLMGPDGAFISPVRAEQSGEEMAAMLGKLVN